MFTIIPAVDIQRGNAVRLFEGDPDRETVYFEDPLDAARHWRAKGAEWLHLVDLDAALGRGENRSLIRRIVDEIDARIEVGGGVRSVDAAREWLEVVDRVILGTVAIERPDVVDALIAEFGAERIVVGIDARKGVVAVKGWRELAGVSAPDLARRVADQGVRTVIYTDVDRDGTMQGVDPNPVADMRRAFPHTLIAGGGVASDDDLDTYERIGLDGAVVGRALYEGTITYPRAS